MAHIFPVLTKAIRAQISIFMVGTENSRDRSHKPLTSDKRVDPLVRSEDPNERFRAKEQRVSRFHTAR